MKKVLFAALLAAGLSACSDAGNDKDLLGSWVEPIPGMEGMQGIRLEENGLASSINMATLRYESWERSGDKLVLRGQSIGNGQTISFSDTLNIVRADGDSLVLGQGDLRIRYAKSR